MTISSELVEKTHYKRRSSFTQGQRNKQTTEQLEEVEVDIDEGDQNAKVPRRKAASVCVAMITMKPDTPLMVSEIPRPNTVHRYGGASRFIVERNCQPLNLQELQSVRLRGLSTSEVFHEPPRMYVYRERPAPYTQPRPTGKATVFAYIKKRKHTICAWTFGLAAVVVMTTIIVLQTTGDFS
ncbi:hypothetical protein OESDEN_01520 [Oesophagostomum dentatum]|uniref:Uncharacterized protein n=1 Tax=Oesophagostomum dentatum TaxID=61180 RepID=A0A0B1TLS0_OESDE|nr:hypothetical protein OESDEN_01520 [Oesophagostomum dentatum]